MRGAIAAALLAGCATAPPLDGWTGEYSRTQVIEAVGEDPHNATSKLVVIADGSDRAFIDVDLTFTNGHMCSLFGIADVEGEALVYREPEPIPDGRHCVLKIERRGGDVVFVDDSLACTSFHCGMRGGFDRVTLPLSSRRPVADPQAFLGANYSTALEEYRRVRR